MSVKAWISLFIHAVWPVLTVYPKKPWVFGYTKSAQHRLSSSCGDTQADSTLPLLYISHYLLLWLGTHYKYRNFCKTWRPSRISEQNHFSNSESLCHCDASNQVSTQSDLRFWRRCRLRNFKTTTMVAILDIGTERFLQFCISMLPQCLPLSFSSIQLLILEEMSKMWKAEDRRRTTDNRQWHKLT